METMEQSQETTATPARKTAKLKKRKPAPRPRQNQPKETPEPQLSSKSVSVTSTVTEANIKKLLHEQKKIKIMIPSGHHEHEKRPVTVQLHGYCYRIQRDTEVEVPESIAKILEEAKQTSIILKPREDGEGMQRVISEGMRFPFQSRA